jgi:hypothetical protein
MYTYLAELCFMFWLFFLGHLSAYYLANPYPFTWICGQTMVAFIEFSSRKVIGHIRTQCQTFWQWLKPNRTTQNLVESERERLAATTQLLFHVLQNVEKHPEPQPQSQTQTLENDVTAALPPMPPPMQEQKQETTPLPERNKDQEQEQKQDTEPVSISPLTDTAATNTITHTDNFIKKRFKLLSPNKIHRVKNPQYRFLPLFETTHRSDSESIQVLSELIDKVEKNVQSQPSADNESNQ